MAYNPLNTSSPVISDSRQTVVDETRYNIIALRDAIVIGTIAGWTLTQSGTSAPYSADRPTYRLWTNGTEILRATFAYSDANAGNYITSVVWEYSSNSGSSYDSIGTSTLTRDGSNNVTGCTNSGVITLLFDYMGKVLALKSSYDAHAAATGSSVHGLGTISTQAASSVAITGGAIDGTTIGGTTKAIGTFKQAREVHVSPSFGTPTTLDWSLGGSFAFTATGSGACTLAFSNVPSTGVAASVVVTITNGGLRTWTYPTGTKWAGGAAPSLSSSGIDILTFITYDGGTTYYASLFGKAFA